MRIFLDSSILIEFEKQTRKDLFLALLDGKYQLYINDIVASEYLYKLVGLLGNKSPLSVCESGKIGEVMKNHQTKEFLHLFYYLPVPEDAMYLATEMMQKYNLLPNDALIVASCKLQRIKVLASYDSDFKEACKAEEILFLQEIEDLAQLE